MFRDYPLGPSCICDKLFDGFKWVELTKVRARDLPEAPGVYVIRVIEKGLSVEEAIDAFIRMLTRTGWDELLDYIGSRLERLRRISECPLIYIGSTPGLGKGLSTLRSRYRDLAGRRHTIFFPILALLMAGWRLDYGFLPVWNHEEAKVLERRLKEEYRRLHGVYPALVAR